MHEGRVLERGERSGFALISWVEDGANGNHWLTEADSAGA